MLLSPALDRMHRMSSRVIPGVATPSLVDLDIFLTNRRVHVLFIFFHAFSLRDAAELALRLNPSAQALRHFD